MALDGQKFLKVALVLLTQMSKVLPPAAVTALNDKVVVELRGMMPNPPTDLEGNHPPLADLGKPGMPYARSVPVKANAPSDLPHPSKVFEKLLERSKTEDPDMVWASFTVYYRT